MGEPKLIAVENEIEDVRQMLRSCLLFSQAAAQADDAAIEFAAGQVEKVAFAKGDCILVENEANDYVYFIAQGSVEIISYLETDKRVQRLSLIKAGSHFAEFSVLSKSARSGSVYAYEDCQLLRMEGTQFLILLKKFPSVASQLVQLLADIHLRMEQHNEFIPFFRPGIVPIEADAVSMVAAPVWKRFGVIPVSIKAGLLTVALQDPHNENFQQFIRASFPHIELAVYIIREADFDGAIEACSRAAKMGAKSGANSAASAKLASAAGGAGKIDILSSLQNSALFGALPAAVLEQVASFSKLREIPAGTNICTPNQKFEEYFLVCKGRVQINRQISGVKSLAPSRVVLPGDGFGDVPILTGKPTTDFIRAMEDTTVVTVPQEVIQQLLQVGLFTVPLAIALVRRLQMLSHVSGLKYFQTITNLDFKAVLKFLPISLITEKKILPLFIQDEEVTLGAVATDSTGVLTIVSRYFTDHRIKIIAITEKQFLAWLPNFKDSPEAGSVHAASGGLSAPGALHAATNKSAQVDAVKWTEQILTTGMGNRCSDIHFEPSEFNLTVRFRIDGVLIEHDEKLGVDKCREVISRLKILAQMDISQKFLPQDGQLKTKVGDMEIVARASSVPVRFGEKIVLRLIRSRSAVVPLSMLVPDRRVTNQLIAVTRCKHGLFLVTGPTGSGKTTTLYSMLSAINRVGVNVITLEDPVEMEIGGFSQLEVDRKRGLDFSLALRSVLRQDPDVIMVGEIRDEESAKIVFEAAITGHLVLSTLHTNSSLDVAPRLAELGVPPATIAAGLLGVLTQRLLRTNCKQCLTTRPSTESEKAYFREVFPELIPPAEFIYGKGCQACQGTGYHGRMPVFEVCRVTVAMRTALIQKASYDEILKIARADGFETLMEFGLKMVLSGLTSIEEVKRVLSNLDW